LTDLNADELGPIYGQKVTASWKPTTYITKDWVYKGPYVGKREKIPAITVSRARLLRQLGDDTALLQEIVFGPNNELYLRSENIGEKWPPITHTDTVRPNLVGRIADRHSMGVYQGLDLIDLCKMQWERAFYHFLIRYIINAGDAHFVNYINNYGVDFEEDRTQDKSEPTTLLEVMFKKPLSHTYLSHVTTELVFCYEKLKCRIEYEVLPHVTGQMLDRTRLILRLLSH
jgi:hypothetical protein